VISQEKNGNSNQPRYSCQSIADLSQTFDDMSKVRDKWTQVLGGGQLWHDTITRVALRKKLGREPTIDDLSKFTGNYTALAKDLKDDVDRAFCKGEEVRLTCFSQSQV